MSTFGGTHLSMKKTRAVKWERGRAKERYSEKDAVNVFLLASGPGGIFFSLLGEAAAVDALTYTAWVLSIHRSVHASVSLI